eukprot:1330281-Amphidinium_carterae.2
MQRKTQNFMAKWFETGLYRPTKTTATRSRSQDSLQGERKPSRPSVSTRTLALANEGIGLRVYDGDAHCLLT